MNHYTYGLGPNDTQNLTIHKATELDCLADEFEYLDECNTHRDENDNENNRRTAKFMAIVSNCSVIIGWNEIGRFESMCRGVYQLLRYLHLGGVLPSAAAYDSACTFVGYLQNQCCVSIMSSPYVDGLLQKKYCINRFHRRNHTRSQCKTTLSCTNSAHRYYFEN